jgi:multidrug efflux pump
MLLTDTAVTRPVFASVISLLLIAFGLVSFFKLQLREYPDIDPPVVSVSTDYLGASASVVESRITEVLEDRIAGIEGIKFISSSSSDGSSRISIEFDVSRNIEAATNDVRDRVSGVVDNLPEEADPPDIQKADSSDDVILWLNLTSDRMDVLALTDFARRYLQDRFSVLPGVARVRVGGGLSYAMRVWLNPDELAARNLTVTDVEAALRQENIELPAGSVESEEVQFTARIERAYRTPDDFQRMVIAGTGESLVRLGDVARIEKEAVEKRTFFRGNGVPMVGIGIIKQSKANTIDVADAARGLADRLRPDLPEGMKIHNSYDNSVFIRNAISEVCKTLVIAIALVVTVIFLFLGNARAMIIPAVTVPVSLVATFIVLWAFDFSINLLTLLALVLAIGLVVDDAIVVLENIHRRIEKGEPPLHAAFYGVRQVSFAVIATTVVLISVFVPITFLEGDLGRLFTEFSLTMAAAVAFSSLVALTLCPVLASILIRGGPNRSRKTADESAQAHSGAEQKPHFFDHISQAYLRALNFLLRHKPIVLVIFLSLLACTYWLFQHVPTEYAPKEDRGAFFIIVNGPEGASFQFIEEYMDEIERRLMPYVDSGEMNRLLVRAPRGFGTLTSFNSGIVIVVLNDWAARRPANAIMGEIAGKIADLPGVRAFPVMRQALGGGINKPVQFVLGGGTYEDLAAWRDIILDKLAEDNPGLTGIDSDYKETKPQIDIQIDTERAGDLGVSIASIGRTLESLLGSRRVTTYLDGGEEYDVVIEGERENYESPTDLENIYVRSDRTGLLISLATLGTVTETAGPSSLNRYNRIRAVTIEAGLADGYTLGSALAHLRSLVRAHLPPTAVIDYRGESLDYQASGTSLGFTFLLGFAVVFLVLAAQFESYIHPFVIILTVPLAIAGALAGLYFTDNTLNVYTQIGLIMLVGLAAKNGILIVEFVNQLRDEGRPFHEAVLEGAQIRLRPIVMTGITTLAGAVPLVLSSGAGSETRYAIGVVILCGVAAATFFTLFIVPTAYDLLARRTKLPSAVSARLAAQQKQFGGFGDGV